jgi:hypothetical protein
MIRSKFLIMFIVLLGFSISVLSKSVYVKGYTRKNGTYVSSHYRSSPSKHIYSSHSYSSYESPQGYESNSYQAAEEIQHSFNLDSTYSKFISEGDLSLNTQYNTAIVNPKLWNNLSYGVKKDLSIQLAVKCGTERGTGIYNVYIYDSVSKNKVASYKNDSALFEVF